ncbi:hypothetical protein VPH35_131549 [Triticum aestivum]
MEQGHGEAAITDGDLERTGVETMPDAVQALVGGAGAGGAASPRAGSVAATADVEEKKVAVADSVVPELGVTASSGPSHGPAEAGGEHVDLQNEEAAGNKRKMDIAGFNDPYDTDNDEEYNSGDEVEEWNHKSFIEHEANKIREKGKAAYYNWGKFMCPYCTTKPIPKDGLYEHLMSHARGLTTSGSDMKVSAKHAGLLKAMGPI